MNAPRTSAVLLALGAAAGAQAPCELAAVDAPSPQIYTAFGQALARSGDVLVVGQPWYSAPAKAGTHFESGRAFVHQRSGASWVLVETLDPPIPSSDLNFGARLELEGDRLVVGCPGWDLPGTVGGAVFVYERSGGSFGVPTLLAPADQTPSARFGSVFELDGDRLVVGAYRGVVAGEARGKAYVFEHAAGAWGETATLVASDGAHLDQFGLALALEGDVLLVGAPNADPVGHESGAVYAFELDGGAWTEVQRLVSTTVEDWQYFGGALELDAGRLFVRQSRGAGTATRRVTTFSEEPSGWVAGQVLAPPANADESAFGGSIEVEGDTLVLSRDGHAGLQESGAVSVHASVGGRWYEVASLEPPEPAELLEFGRPLALEGDRLVVGAHGYADFSGRVYEFALPGVVVPFGEGVAGARGVPCLGASGCSAVGRTLVLEVSGGAPGAAGLLLTSPTPGSFPAFGGTLWLAPPWGGVFPHVLDVDGAASFPFPLGPGLAGQAFAAQAGHLDAAAPRGVALTRGLGVVVR